MVKLTIDGKEIQAPEGEKLLWAALDNGIYIPHLCAIREAKEPYAGCRLCFVEVGGRGVPVTACTEPVAEGLVVHTTSERVDRLVRTVAELLLASHPVDCANCPANGRCELQKLAKHLRIKLKTRRFPKMLHEWPIDATSGHVILDPNKCVLCHRCIWVCQQRGVGTLGFVFRGFERRIGTFDGQPLAEMDCDLLRGCAAVCPVGALVAKS